jgi:hypothetical protein
MPVPISISMFPTFDGLRHPPRMVPAEHRLESISTILSTSSINVVSLRLASTFLIDFVFKRRRRDG